MTSVVSPDMHQASGLAHSQKELGFSYVAYSKKLTLYLLFTHVIIFSLRKNSLIPLEE